MARTLVGQTKDTRKNWLINGNMAICQRGNAVATPFTSIANNVYMTDRYVYGKSGAMVHNVSQDTDVPTLAQANYLFQNSLRLNLTTPDTSIAAGDYAQIVQKIEGFNYAQFAQKIFTLSFWVKATTPGIYCVAFVNGGNDRSYVAEYTISAASTWEYKTVTIAAAPPSAGTWNYSNGVGLQVVWSLAAGSTYQTTAGSWQTGNFVATSNQVNGVNTGATDFRLTGCALNEGASALPFRLFAADQEGEVAACQRYFEKSYDLDVPPSTVTGTGPYMWTAFRTGSDWQTIVFKVKKRTTPTCIPYSPTSGAANTAHQDDVSAVDKGTSNSSAGMNSFAFFVSGDLGAQTRAHWTAEAEL